MAKKTLAEEVLELVQKQQALFEEMHCFMARAKLMYLSQIDEIDRRIADFDKPSKEGEDAADRLNGVNEMEAACQAFAEANKDVVSFYVDNKRKGAVRGKEPK